jgi:hypothetical protein
MSRNTPLDDFILVHPAGLSARKGDAGSVAVGDTKDFAVAMKRGGQKGRRVISVNAGSLSKALDDALAKLPRAPRDEYARIRTALDEWADVAGRRVHVEIRKKTGT